MLCASPLHVQHSPKPLFPDAATLAYGRNDAPLREERHIWDYCLVSSALSVQFFRFRDELQTSGSDVVGEGSTYFTLSCVNAEEVVRRAGAMTAVRSGSCISRGTAAPRVSGSQRTHALALLDRYSRALPPLFPDGLTAAAAVDLTAAGAGEGADAANSSYSTAAMKAAAGEREKKDFCHRHREWLGYLSLALRLPTVAALVQSQSQGGMTMLLVLQPHVHAGKSASIAYAASLIPVSAIARSVTLSPCGSAVLCLPDRFESVEDPLRACEETTRLLTGQTVDLRGDGEASAASAAAQPLHVLAGEAVRREGLAGRRPPPMERLMGSSIAWAQCRRNAAGHVELVLLGRCGVGIVCVAAPAGPVALCGSILRVARCLVCGGLTGPVEESVMASRRPTLASPTAPLAIEDGGRRENSASERMVHVSRPRVVGSSRDGMVLVCASEAARGELTVVRTAAAPPPYGPVPPGATSRLPASFELQDVYVVDHPQCCGALLLGLPRDPGLPASGPTSKSSTSKAHDEPPQPLLLRYLIPGERETTPVPIMAYRQWKSIPPSFFSKRSIGGGAAATKPKLRLLRVETVADPVGTPSLLVALGSSSAPNVVATLLVPLPRCRPYIASTLMSSESPSMGCGLWTLVETHVTQRLALLARRREWCRQQRLALDEHHLTSSGVSSSSPLDEALPFALEFECVEVLRDSVLVSQRTGADLRPCLGGVYHLLAAVQAGVGTALVGSGAAGAVEAHDWGVLRGLAEVVVAGIEVLQLSGSASALETAAAVLQAGMPRGTSAGEHWARQLRPAFEMVFMSTAGTPLASDGILDWCSEGTLQLIHAGRELLEAEEEQRSLIIGGTTYSLSLLRAHEAQARSLEDVVSCVEAGPGGWEALSVLDIFSAARRLFLSGGAGAAVRLLKTLCNATTCAESVRQLHEMYVGLEQQSFEARRPTILAGK